MVNHPSRNKLAVFGGRIIHTDGLKTVEFRDANDNAKRRFQYRRLGDGVERRVLQSNGQPFIDAGSPWEPMTEDEIAQLRSVRGQYHPVLDPLGLGILRAMTTRAYPTTPPRPRGRPPAAPDRARTAVVRARVTQAQAEKFERLGGAAWLRQAIESAREVKN